MWCLHDFKPTTPARRKLLIRLVPVALALLSAPALAADSCRFSSALNQAGSSKTWELPDVDETLGTASYSTSSRRGIGAELDVPANAAVYENAESVRLTAADTAVELYVYTGDNMDGVFQRIHCNQGSVCTWNFGSMRNKVKSFSCQREVGVTPIPTRDVADTLTEQLDTEMPTSPQIDNSTIKYGQLLWTNVRARCERDNVGCGGSWQDKYRDTLEYRGRFTLDIHPAWLTKKYDAWFRFWIDPRASGADRTLIFEETYYKITVESGALSNAIADGLEDGISGLFDGNQDLGGAITDSVHAAILELAGSPVWASLVIDYNDRLYPAYDCVGANSDDHTFHWPNYTYTNYNLSTPCGYGMPVTAFAPIIRLVKDFGGP